MISNTTRRHPRSLADAFPQERAQWLEGPTRRDVDRPVMIAAAVCFVALCVLLVLEKFA